MKAQLLPVRALGAALVLVSSAFARNASAEAPPAWSARLSVAIGIPLRSAHESLLNADSYSEDFGVRYAARLELSHAIASIVGVGLRGEAGYRDASSDNPHSSFAGDSPAPSYQEQLFAAAVEAPLTLLRSERVRWVVTPHLGWGTARGYFYDAGAWQRGLWWGLETGAYFPKPHVGCALGVDSLRVPAQTPVDGSNDFGMIYLALSAGFDVAP